MTADPGRPFRSALLIDLMNPKAILFFTALLPQFVQSSFFDSRWTNWVGLVTHKPVTEDYVPVLPWLGVMLWGLAAGQWLLARRPRWLGGGLPVRMNGLWAVLVWLGRHPLWVYMPHQPLLIGLLRAWRGA